MLGLPMTLDALMLSRLQFAFTLAFHIAYPSFSIGLASFLAVLKAFGDVPSPGMLSFPKPGITLALDFPIKPEKSFALFDKLANMTYEFGGRLYPAKDARMTAQQYQAFYSDWERFARYKDPALTSGFWERVAGVRGGKR